MIDAVAVTGPQRAGTTITARILADLCGWRFVDETEYGTYDEDRFREILEAPQVVVQAPTMFAALMRYTPPQVLVVLVRRDLDAIYRSQERIGWRPDWEPVERARLGVDSDSAAEKYRRWDRGPRPASSMELPYGIFCDHPFWVPAEGRAGFLPKQTIG